MYILYLSSLSFILFTLYNCFSNKINKNITVKKLDHKKNYSFIIRNIEFFKNGKCVEFTNYNNYYFKQNNIELNVNFIYDFFVVNYIYDNTGENPYYAILATSDVALVTPDSVNMLSETLTAGLPTFIFDKFCLRGNTYP